jgi:hypothetical protein
MNGSAPLPVARTKYATDSDTFDEPRILLEQFQVELPNLKQINWRVHRACKLI